MTAVVLLALCALLAFGARSVDAACAGLDERSCLGSASGDGCCVWCGVAGSSDGKCVATSGDECGAALEEHCGAGFDQVCCTQKRPIFLAKFTILLT